MDDFEQNKKLNENMKHMNMIIGMNNEIEKLNLMCRRLVLILNETLSYVDDIDEFNKLSKKIEEIKKTLVYEIGLCHKKIDKDKCGCGKLPHKGEDPEIIEYLKSIEN